MKKILYPILAVIVFVIMQAAAGVVVCVAAIIKDRNLLDVARTGDQNALMSAVDVNALAWGIILSGLVTVGVIALLKMIDWKTVFDFKMINWKESPLAIIGAVLGIFALDIFEEMMDLPNEMEDVFLGMSNTLVGALSISVVGPIIEEFIFREGILGYMLRNGVNKWGAIVASALVFGIIHLNPAQVPFAAAMGIILGIIYYKTGNIVLTCILHIVNNSMFTLMSYTMGDAVKDASLVESLGGTVVAVIIGILSIGLCVLFLKLFWKRSSRNEIDQSTRWAEVHD